MMLPFSRRWSTLAAVAFTFAVIFSASASAREFDGIWSVSIVGDDANCPAQTIPVRVSDGTVSFSGFGATASGAVSASGAIRLKISLSQQVVRINGKAHGRVASGSWRTAPAGCEGHWKAQIVE
jgi:hypothetical protein